MLLRRIIIPYTKSTLSINNSLPYFLNCINTTAESPYTAATTDEEEKIASTITTICKSFPNKLNWQTLNQKLKCIDVRSSTLINRVIIQLKDPLNAKKALSFFHWSSHFTKITHQAHTYALLIHILVDAKLIKDAIALIESVLTRSDALLFVHSLISTYEVTGSTPFVFDLLIQICSKLRMIDDAIDVCFCLGEHAFRLSVISYNTLLHVIQKSDKTKLVWKVYEHMIDHKTYPNEKTVGIMVKALCKEGKLQSFVYMIDRIDGKRCLPKVIVNTCLIFQMIEELRIDNGLVLLKRMLIKNMINDTISCSLIVYAKIKIGELESAWKVFDEMLKRGFKPNSFVYTSFIGAYCEAGKMEDGEAFFKEMESVGLQPYDETYTHMIVGYSKVGKSEESLKFCDEMVKNGFIPSCSAFNEVVERVDGHENVCRANEMLTILLDKGFVPDVNTYSYLISGYGREGDVEGVLKLFYEMEYRKLSGGELVFIWLIVSLYRVGRLEESKKYMSMMKARCLVPLDCTYDAFISNHEMDKAVITS